MAVVFLMGGTGNQLFAYTAASERDTVSTVLLHPFACKLLGWSAKERLFQYEPPNAFAHIVAMGAVALDVLVYSLTRRSCFTDFDTRHIRASARYRSIARVGYFHQAPTRRSVHSLAQQIAPKKAERVLAVHVRGGDLLVREREDKQSRYGTLDGDYYRRSIASVRDRMAEGEGAVAHLWVFTDDPAYAEQMDLSVDGVPAPEVRCISLKDTVEQAMGADWFIASNSTLSYWIVRLRDGKRCIAPLPFHLRYDYAMPPCVVRQRVDYE